MDDIRQIQLIANSLNKEKDKYVNELSKLNATITSKRSMIIKMQSYKNDYLNTHNLNLSKSIPGLHKNIDMFVKKITIIISQAETEVDALLRVRSSLLDTIEKLDKKINLMTIFENKSKFQLMVKEERQEQNAIDDISSTMIRRREHE